MQLFYTPTPTWLFPFDQGSCRRWEQELFCRSRGLRV